MKDWRRGAARRGAAPNDARAAVSALKLNPATVRNWLTYVEGLYQAASPPWRRSLTWSIIRESIMHALSDEDRMIPLRHAADHLIIYSMNCSSIMRAWADIEPFLPRATTPSAPHTFPKTSKGIKNHRDARTPPAPSGSGPP